MDYIPLATMLATGQLAEADQVSIVDVLSVCDGARTVNGYPYPMLHIPCLLACYLQTPIIMMSTCTHTSSYLFLLLDVVVYSRCVDSDFRGKVEEQRLRVLYRC